MMHKRNARDVPESHRRAVAECVAENGDARNELARPPFGPSEAPRGFKNLR